MSLCGYCNRSTAKSHEPFDYLSEHLSLYSDLFCWSGMRRRDERVVQQRHGTIDEMEKEKSIPDWVQDQSAMFAFQLRFMLYMRTHCAKSLRRLWTKKVFSQRLSQLQKTFGEDKLSGHWLHSEIRNWINEWFLWSDRAVWNYWINGQINDLFSLSLFLTLSYSVCFCRASLKTDNTCLRTVEAGEKKAYATGLRPVNSVHFSVFYWV